MKRFANWILAAALLVPTFALAEQPSASPTPTASGVVNVVSASAEELERLPGIGPSKAKAIVEHRKNHPFHKVEEITKVRGIGRKMFVRLRPYLTLNGPTTLKERNQSQMR
jgi:competence protein ComEA